METVNHPSHYNLLGRKECIEQMIDDFGKRTTAIFCLTNAYKYLYRAGNKNGSPLLEDIAKAKFYVNFVDQRLESAVTGKSMAKLYYCVTKGLAQYDKS